jgi:hypothetical protein
MKHSSVSLTLCLSALFLAAGGCNKQANYDANYKAAINDHFKASPVCIWAQPKKLPAQAATSDDAKTEGYDALTQAGLLTRTTAEKKVLIIASKQVNNYDLSDTGKTTWTADPTQPGYGNFCYGHRDVTSIDNSTVNGSGSAKTATVNYHYKIADIPDWAKTQEMQTAFPSIASAINQTTPDTATLSTNGDQWVFSGK